MGRRNYYENKKEFQTLEGKSPEESKEAILLHEIQHILQSAHYRSSGTSRTFAEVQANARIDALRDREKFGAIILSESRELQFYLTLSNSELCNLFYLNNPGEREARKTVRRWLLKKGIRYVDPLTTDYGIEVVDDLSSGGGGVLGKPYYLLTCDEVISERGRLEAIGAKNFTFEESYRMRDLARYSVAKFGVLLSKLEK